MSEIDTRDNFAITGSDEYPIGCNTGKGFNLLKWYSKNHINQTSTGPDKMSGLERIPVYRGFFYLPIYVVNRHSNYSLH